MSGRWVLSSGEVRLLIDGPDRLATWWPRLLASNNLPQDGSAAEFAQRIAAETAQLQRLLQRRPIKLQ